MRKFLTFALALCLALPLLSQPRLKFPENRPLKIVQLTDLHYSMTHPAAKDVRALVNGILGTERPDLIVLTGDVIYANPADENLREILTVIDSYDIPFCYLFGNHDYQFGFTNSELYDIATTFKNCINPPRGDVASPDFTVEMLSSSADKVAALIYCFDSNAHVFDQNGEYKGYDWIHESQIEAYRERSAAYTASNGGTPLPALGFFHIPLPEYREASASDQAPIFGTRLEACCAPHHNSGMFDAILECKDIFATFVGHDHDNDYVTMWKNVLLCYGRFSGGDTIYNDIEPGARVILLREGERRFETYIRLSSGEVIGHATFPDCFTKR